MRTARVVALPALLRQEKGGTIQIFRRIVYNHQSFAQGAQHCDLWQTWGRRGRANSRLGSINAFLTGGTFNPTKKRKVTAEEDELDPSTKERKRSMLLIYNVRSNYVYLLKLSLPSHVVRTVPPLYGGL